MYRQILVDPNQRDLQRIMWKTSADAPVKTYKLATVTYGTVSAPFLATRTLRALADEEKAEFPDAADVICNDSYMDDILSGESTLEGAKKLQTRLSQLLQRGGFELHKWVSNSPELLKDLSTSSYVFDKEFQDAPVKTLEIARLYDPLGLIGPIVTKAKIFIQELWKIKLDWSEQLPPDAMEEWMNFYQKLAKVNNFKIPRCILLPSTIRIEIHGFSDASERAYAAVVYIKCFNESGQSQTRLLCSKSRVAPLKTLTIPRFINNIKAKESCNKKKYLTADEVKSSTEFLAKIAQLSEFKAEIDALKKKVKGVSKTSKLKALDPFLDENSLLRVGGRLCNADLPFEAKHQIIIPSKHKFTKLLLSICIRSFHIGAQGLVHQIRMQFWPINGKGIARKTVHDCIACFRQKPTGVDQLMGNLPSESNSKCTIFKLWGGFFCGPFQIKFKNQRKGIFSKVYVAIFVCLATKAIHLEAVTDLTTEAFIAALKRLCARRGRISTLMSDNATNFKGAAAELNRFIKLICNKNETLANYFASEAIQWKFIPPRSPNFGVLPLSDNINEYEVLTPGHFIIGRPISAIPEPAILDISDNRLSRWQYTTKCVQTIWKRWKNDYLNHLQQRNKWQFEKNNVAVGCLVLLKENDLPPCKWTMARILEVIYGTDGKNRQRNEALGPGIPCLKTSLSPIRVGDRGGQVGPCPGWQIVRKAVTDRSVTSRSIAQHIESETRHSVFARTIRRRLQQSGLSARRPLLGLALTQNPRRLLCQWCDERRMWATEWNEVVFTDESRICLQHHDGRIQVWRHHGERMLNSCVMHRHTGPAPGIMVWGGIGYHSRIPLVRIAGTLKSQRYISEVLEAVVLPYLQGLATAIFQ
ncbi:integrase catalytic domain-containing protein [Trichonephila clavipes]|uniref:Integrase catalytic domain-containing protein n=1 Tax=Trichonephila clavipes TaxID=2585209 RepID=A0A8X6W5F1_TRICX|nr:integrase catalytic domain-containing protein [Trichonephila clavipes]